MSFPGTILMGAQARLLDPTIPYRYFAAALVFHILLWVLVVIYPDSVAIFSGGPGPALAALHSLTLGILTMTALGAAFQMLPVATGRPLRSIGAARIASWFFIPGTAILVDGMLVGEHIPMMIGGLAVAVGLALFVGLIGELLWHARAMEPVAGFGLAALFALVLTIILGAAFIADDDLGFLDNRYGLTGIHLIAAIFGFMGLLAVGFSHVLIPLFTLAPGAPAKESRAAFALAIIALPGAMAGIYNDQATVIAISAFSGLTAAAIHIRSMERCLRSGMRKDLGVAVFLIRTGWIFLITGIITAIAASAGFLGDQGVRFVVFFALFGWLLTFLLGVLQRILPFLGAMNATGMGGKPPRPSELAPERVLRVQAACHMVALGLVGAGLALENELAVRLGGLSGLIGAVIYAYFAARIWWLIHGRPGHTS